MFDGKIYKTLEKVIIRDKEVNSINFTKKYKLSLYFVMEV